MNKRKTWISKGWCALIPVLSVVLSLGGCGFLVSETENSESEIQWAEIGEEVETQKIAETDGNLYPVSYQITQIHRDPEYVEEVIEEYNFSGTGSPIGEVENEKLQYGIADYLVTFPEDFPSGEYGVTNTPIEFKVVALDGGDIIKVDGINYKNLNDTVEIGDVPMGFDFFPPQTYEGQFVFLMVRDYGDYLFQEIPPEEREGAPQYIRGK